MRIAPIVRSALRHNTTCSIAGGITSCSSRRRATKGFSGASCRRGHQAQRSARIHIATKLLLRRLARARCALVPRSSYLRSPLPLQGGRRDCDRFRLRNICGGPQTRRRVLGRVRVLSVRLVGGARDGRGPGGADGARGGSRQGTAYCQGRCASAAARVVLHLCQGPAQLRGCTLRGPLYAARKNRVKRH